MVTLVTINDREQDGLSSPSMPKCMRSRRATGACLRPWGCYEGMNAGERFPVSRIVMRPGAVLVVNSGKEIFLSENQSSYIPLGEIHHVESPGKVSLELLEEQSESYLDDIVNFDDQYWRIQ